MRLFFLLLLIPCLAIPTTSGRSETESEALYRIDFTHPSKKASRKEKQANYRLAIAQLEQQRQQFQREWKNASTPEERTHLLSRARETVLGTLLRDLFPAWDGAPWDFNGITQVPGEGKIACGYFVTTCLRDAGFDLPRIKLAQQPSQTIIRSLADKAEIHLFYQRPISEIETHLKESGRGLYIVGLDCHTGFVVNDGRRQAFIHASYFDPPRAVIAEPLTSQNPLVQSKYRMIGKVLGDRMMEKWINGTAFPMKTS